VLRAGELKTKTNEFATKHHLEKRFNFLARLLVCLYFVNSAYTSIQIWYVYRQPFDPWAAVILPAALCVIIDFKTNFFASVLLIFAAWESGHRFYTQISSFILHGSLYINELMVKKLSLLGATALIIAQRFQIDKQPAAIAGLVLEAKKTMSTQKSFVMLLGRLMMSSLFLYVGITEVRRQMDNTMQIGGQVHHRRPAGDGHDNMWSKLIELVLCIPFVIGFKTNFFARSLAVVLVLEAFINWSWYTSNLHAGYIIHAREHFFVNMGVAGGVILLSMVGAGKYTVDELLKKNE